MIPWREGSAQTRKQSAPHVRARLPQRDSRDAAKGTRSMLGTVGEKMRVCELS